MNHPQPHLKPLAAFAAYGIEAEYMIVDRRSLDVRPIADELLRAAAGRYVAEVERDGMGWSKELALHVLEVKNERPQPNIEDLPASFAGEVRAINALLESEDACLMPSAMHPWMDPKRQTRIWNREPSTVDRSYDRIFDCHQHGWANLQSIHVNLPFADDAEFARLHAAVRAALPLLPALAASSPFAEGRATGYADFRMQAYSTHQMLIPASMGRLIPENAHSRAQYEEEVLLPIYREIVKVDVENALRHEWLNARAAIPRFDRSALEIRVIDAQECPRADMAVAAAAVALVRRLYDGVDPERLQAVTTDTLVGQLHACIRDADEAMVEDAGYLRLLGLPGRPCRAGDLWARLVDDLSSQGLLSSCWAEPLGVILRHGPLARRLLAAAGREPGHERLQAVYRRLCECLQHGELFLPD